MSSATRATLWLIGPLVAAVLCCWPARVWAQHAVDGAAPPGLTDSSVADGSAVGTALAKLRDARNELDAWSEQSTQEEVRAYCEHLRAAQRSDSALLRSPWLAARGSTLQRGELVSPTRAVSARMRVGLGFSVSDWMRADLLAEHAERTCRVYRAELGLRDTTYDVDAVTLDGWQEKVQVLTAALEPAAQLLAQSERELQTGERTVTTHLLLVSAEQRLLEALSDAETRVARLASAVPPAPLASGQLVELRNSVAELERVEGELRRNRALSFSVEGGYDEIIGIAQSLPAYGQLSVTFRPGYFWQGSADELSARSKAHAAAERASRAERSIRRALLTLHAQVPAMQVAAARLKSLIATLEQRSSALGLVQNAQAPQVVQRLWFELQLRRAELAQVTASLGAIERWTQQFRGASDNSGSAPRTSHRHNAVVSPQRAD